MLQEAGLLGFVLSISLFRYASAQAGAFSANLQQPAQKQPPQQPHRLSVPSPRKYLAQHHFQSAEIYNTFDGGFWFAEYKVGKDTLSCLVDSGSADVIVNPGFYVPSKNAVFLHENFTSSYYTTQPNGTGYGTSTIELYNDTVSLGNLHAHNQTIGNITFADPEPLLPHQCLVGWSGPDESEWDTTPFLYDLCDQIQVQECRFGLAYGTNGTGTQVVGEVDRSLYSGDLFTVPAVDTWNVYADITLDGNVISSNATIYFDSGTANIIGSISEVQKWFDAAGISTILYNYSLEEGGNLLQGYYDCAHPPDFGLRMNGTSEGSTGLTTMSKTFEVLPKPFAYAKNGPHNCTATLAGIEIFGGFDGNFWVVGQTFFQGKYVDHNVSPLTMGFANLKSG